MKKLSQFVMSFAVLLVIISGCSGGDSNSGNDSSTIDVIGIDKLKYVVAQQADHLQTGEEITVNDQTYYLLKGITASAGQELTINLKTMSQLPGSAMSHNWLLLQMDANAKAFNDSSLSAKDNDYVSPSMEDQVITDTGLVPGGETKSVSFTVPEQTGEYDYLCTFPAHFSAGMRGTLTVE